MNKFQFKKIGKTAFSNGTNMTTLKLFNKDRSELTFKDAADIAQWMTNEGIKKGDHHIRVGIRALAIDGWKSIKNLSTNIETEADYDEYYSNKVIHSTKYHEFSQFQVFILK
jgi:hypothetical protein